MLWDEIVIVMLGVERLLEWKQQISHQILGDASKNVQTQDCSCKKATGVLVAAGSKHVIHETKTRLTTRRSLNHAFSTCSTAYFDEMYFAAMLVKISYSQRKRPSFHTSDEILAQNIFLKIFLLFAWIFNNVW